MNPCTHRLADVDWARVRESCPYYDSLFGCLSETLYPRCRFVLDMKTSTNTITMKEQVRLV